MSDSIVNALPPEPITLDTLTTLDNGDKITTAQPLVTVDAGTGVMEDHVYIAYIQTATTGTTYILGFNPHDDCWQVIDSVAADEPLPVTETDLRTWVVDRSGFNPDQLFVYEPNQPDNPFTPQ